MPGMLPTKVTVMATAAMEVQAEPVEVQDLLLPTEADSWQKAVFGPPFAVGGDRDMVMLVRWGRQDSIRIH